jgi:hypothetical protein
MRNKFHVGATGKRVAISNLAKEPELTPDEALELAAWLVAAAVPLLPGDVGEELKRFLNLVADANEGLADAVRAELAE